MGRNETKVSTSVIVEAGSWAVSTQGFIILFRLLLYMFKIFHNKKLKGEEEAACTELSENTAPQAPALKCRVKSEGQASAFIRFPQAH